MPSLEEQYEEAAEAYRNDPTDENREKFHEARDDLSDARSNQRRTEEQDPNNSRGQALVVAENDAESE